MFTVTHHRLAHPALIPQQPNEFHDDFTLKSAATLSAGLQTFTSDSGHAYFATGTVSGGFKASPKDGTIVWTLSATSGTGAAYLNASLGGVVYGWVKMRFVGAPGQTTHNSAAGLIPWSIVTPNSDADSGAHCVITENEVYFQQVNNGNVTITPIGGGSGAWSYTDPVEEWFETEWAIAGNDLVVRTYDGSTHTYSNVLLQTYLGNWLCAEPARNLSTDWTPEYAAMKGSTLEGMSDAQLLYYNNLLATQGIGPVSKPADLVSGSPTLVATGGATWGTSGQSAISFTAVSGGTYTCTAGDQIVAFYFNDDTGTLTTAPTGYTAIASVQNGSACSGIAFAKTAVGGETSTPAPGAQADGGIVLVFSSCSGFGATGAAGSGSTATHVIPSVGTPINLSTGKSRKLFLFGRRGTVTNANIDAPPGFSRTMTQEGVATGNNSVLGAYLANSNLTADASGVFGDAAGAQFDSCLSIELLGAMPTPTTAATLVGVIKGQEGSFHAVGTFYQTDGVTPFTAQAGDKAIFMAYQDDSTNPVNITSDHWASYFQLGTNISGSNSDGALGYKTLAAGETNTGPGTTADHADDVIGLIYRNCGGFRMLASDTAIGDPASIPGGTLMQTNGTSKVIAFTACRSLGISYSTATAPSGMTFRAEVNANPSGVISSAGVWDTSTGVTSWSSTNITLGSSTNHTSFVVEVLGT